MSDTFGANDNVPMKDAPSVRIEDDDAPVLFYSDDEKGHIKEEEEEEVMTNAARLASPVKGWLHPYFDARITLRICCLCKTYANTLAYTCQDCGLGRCMSEKCKKYFVGYHKETCKTMRFDQAEAWIRRVLDPTTGENIDPLIQFLIHDFKARSRSTEQTDAEERLFYDALRNKGFPKMKQELLEQLLQRTGVPSFLTVGDDMTMIAFWTMMMDFDTSNEARALITMMRKNQEMFRRTAIQPGAGTEKKEALIPSTLLAAFSFLSSDNNLVNQRTKHLGPKTIYQCIIGNGIAGSEYAMPTLAFAHDLAKPACNVIYLINMYHMQDGEMEHLKKGTKPKTGRHCGSHSMVVRLMGKSEAHPADEMFIIQAHEDVYGIGHTLGVQPLEPAVLKPSEVDGLFVLQGQGHPHYWGRVKGREKITEFATLLEVLGDPAKESQDRKAAYAKLTSIQWGSSSPMYPFRVTLLRANLLV